MVAVPSLDEVVVRAWHAWAVTDRVHVVGRCMWSAAITALLLQTLESPQGAPFRRMVPMVLAISGLVTEIFAVSIGRSARLERDR